MRSVVDWLLAQRYRLILLAVALVPFLAPVSTALLALETVRRGASQGLLSAGLALGGTLVLALVTGSNVPVLAALGAVSFLSGVLIGVLLIRAGGSLAGTFQGILLICVAAALVIGLGGSDPRGMLGPALDQLIELLRERGAVEEQIELLLTWQHMLIGLLAAVIFGQLVAALCLAHWWWALADGEERFGAAFRELRLGRQLGIAALVLVALSLVLDASLVQNLTPLALFAFLFQGLAVLHAWAHARSWHPVAVVPVYVLLVTPLMGIVVLGLSSVGLVDNIFDLRAPLRPGV